MEKKRPKEQPWVLMAWISFLVLIVTAPMILHEESIVYRAAMFGAVVVILAWSALLLHSSLKEARRDRQVDEESDVAPVGGGAVQYTPLAAGTLVGACALALGIIALVPDLGPMLWAVVGAIGAGVVLLSLVYRHVARKRNPATDHDPAAEQVRSAEVPEHEE
ncbi:MAG: hypothetical protein ACOCZU_06510 [Planctomycetota bacterium]